MGHATAVDFQRAFESLPGRYAVLSPEGVFLAVTDDYTVALGARREHLLGTSIPEALPHAPIDLVTSFRTAASSKHPHTFRAADSRGAAWRVSHKPVLSPSGELLHLIQDLAEAPVETDPSEAVLAGISDAIAVLTGPEFTIRSTNAAFERLFGAASEVKFLQLAPGCVTPQDLSDLRSAGPDAEPLRVAEWPLCSHNGAAADSERFLSLTFRVLPGDRSDLVVCARDVTDAVLTRQALARERREFRALLDEIPAHVVTLRGPDLVYDITNRAFLEFNGNRPAAGLRLREAWPVPDEHVDLLRSILATGEAFVGREAPVPRPTDAAEIGFFDFMFQPIRAESGAVSGVFVYSQDVTETVLARRQVEALNAELETRVEARTAELMAKNYELEGFTYSVSHDMRGPLRAIVAHANIVLEEHGERLDDAGRASLERLAAAALKMARLVDDLLNYARLGNRVLHRETVDLSGMVRSVASEVGSEYPGIEIRLTVPDSIHVSADPVFLALALRNLIDNACKYRNADEPATIEFGVSQQGSETVYFLGDQGIGFDMAYSAKLFRPFERLHRDESYAGTGIGLANVRRAIERHGGRVWAESKLGEGSRFHFTLEG